MNTGMNITKKAEIFASHLVEVAPHIGRIKPSLLLPKEILEKRRLGRKDALCLRHRYRHNESLDKSPDRLV